MPKTSEPKPVTPWSERCDKSASKFHYLGIERLTRLPDAGFPPRDICQSIVTAEEKAAGIKLVADYRAAETAAIENDASATMHRIEREGNAFEVIRLRAKLQTMSEKAFYDAQSRLNEIRQVALALCQPILQRLIEEFDRQLNESALRHEEELTKFGIPIIVSDGYHNGCPVKIYELHNTPLLNGLQVRREICRHKLMSLDRGSSVGLTQWLCTDEQAVPFQWL